MKKGAIEISATMLATIVFILLAVMILFLVFGTFAAESGRTSSGFYYRVLDWIGGLVP